jgi:hypothetical protein
MGKFVGMPRKMVGWVVVPIEVIGVLIMIGLGVLVLLAIEFGMRLRGQPVTGLLSDLREDMRLIGKDAAPKAESPSEL